MRLFVVRSDLAFALLRRASEDPWLWRGGVPVTQEEWRVSDLTVAEGGRADFIGVDCLELISGSDGFVLSEFARDKLEPLLLQAGEFWPVTVFGCRYWWFNCLACVEALDRRRTEADWGSVEGEWGAFQWITATRRLAFKRGRVAEAPALFRVPEYPQGVLFGTEALAQAVQEHELTGFQFDMVWSEETGGVSDPPGVGLAGVFEPVSVGDLARRRADALSVLERRRGRSG